MPPDHRELLAKAKKEIEIADHLIYVTYQMVSEVKILMAISEHIINAAHAALESLLEFERYYKRLDAYHQSFALEISIYRTKDIEKRHGFDPKFYRLLQKLMEIQKFDKTSIMRFKRGDRYILSTVDYQMSVLDLDNMKRYKYLTKKFIDSVDLIISKTQIQPK
ncbi:MAG: hypothetical protein V1839_03575 [archaeon]